jgi:hypothetical protein
MKVKEFKMSNDETPPAAPTTPAASPFNADGTFVENWQTLAPEGYEDLKEDKTLPRFKNVWDTARSYVSVRKQVGVDKMPRPNENWGDAEWNEFYDAGGRPKTAKDYNVKIPKDFPPDKWDQVKADKYQEMFHKIGLSKKQADQLIAFNNEDVLATLKGMEERETQFNTELWDKLHAKWGRAYDQNVFRGEKAIERGCKGDEGFKQRILDKVNKDADLIEYVANMESFFVEHGVVEDPSIPTPDDLKSQIARLMADPRYNSKEKSIRQPLIDQVQRLFAQMNKEKQPV